MCRLTVKQCDLLWNCIAPYVHLITYYETALSNKVHPTLLRQKSELVIVLTCCKHGLNLGIREWMAGISESSMQRLLNIWMIFLASLFDYASKGIFHNLPAMKFNDQFVQFDIADNFDILILHSHQKVKLS